MTNSTALTDRLRKRFKHLKKWADRSRILCFRIYHKDISEFPVIIDWYDGDVVLWISNRVRDESAEQKEDYHKMVIRAVCQACEIKESRVFVKHRSREKGVKNQYQRIVTDRSIKIIEEYGVRFEVNLSNYVDTGLFLDHRDTRAMFREMAKGARCLNLFAYTGSFSCYAALGGALSVTTVDMNPNYMAWAQRNLDLNGFSDVASYRCITENCLSFIKQDASKHRYDLIICDPPTFSNSKKMRRGAFSVTSDYLELLTDCMRLLAPKGKLIFSTNARQFKLASTQLPKSWQVKEITQQTMPEDFKRIEPPAHQCWMISRP